MKVLQSDEPWETGPKLTELELIAKSLPLIVNATFGIVVEQGKV